MSTYDVRKAGAKGDGIALETKVLQATIDHCAEKGGGTVLIPAGCYRTGTLVMRSHVTLHLDSGATLLGSADIADYASAATFRDAVGCDRGQCLIFAKGVEDIAIEGRGVIDGQGAGFRDPYRPMLLRFLNCQRVAVSGVTLKDAGAWVQHYLECDDVELQRVTVLSRVNGNNDGLNLDGCQRVRVSDCHFSSGDDALTLKCTTPRPCKDIVISNCLLSSDCNGLKFGTESRGGFENVTITNCAIYDTRLCGITVATVDGAKMENIIITNISMRDVGAAIFVRLGSRGYHLPKEVQPRPCGSMRNLIIRNVLATGVDSHGSAIMGLPGHPIENVMLDHVVISSRGGGTKEDAGKPVEEAPERYPQYNQWGNLPAYGLYARHVRHLSKSQIRFELTGSDPRPPLVCDDVTE